MRLFYWALFVAMISQHVRSDAPSMQEGLNLAEGKPGIVVDVGANGGAETILAIRQNRKVLAVECLSEAYTSLVDKLVGIENVTLIHACAGANTEIKTLHLADDSSSLIAKNIASGAERRKANRPHNRKRKNIEHVVTVPLDNLVNEPVALIKIDVQGFESEVLMGAQKILSTYKPFVVYETPTSLFSRTTVQLPQGYTCHKNGGDEVCAYNST